MRVQDGDEPHNRPRPECGAEACVRTGEGAGEGFHQCFDCGQHGDYQRCSDCDQLFDPGPAGYGEDGHSDGHGKCPDCWQSLLDRDP